MKKKIIALCLIVALAITAVTGATLAYFTDLDNKTVNNFTIGNVQIDLTETAGVTDKDGNEVEDVVTENKDGGYDYKDLMPTYTLEKKPVVKNTGSYPAYVRVAVVMNNLSAINDAIDGTYEAKNYDATAIQDIYDEVFDGWGVNYSKRAAFPSGSRMWMDSRVGEGSPVLCNIDTIARISDKYYRIDSANAFMTEIEAEKENGDGIFDTDFDADWFNDTYYVNAAKTDERVYVFYLKLDADESYTLFNGLTIPEDFTAEQMAMFNGLKIGVYADAIQTAGFDTYTDAFNALEAEHPLGYWNT